MTTVGGLPRLYMPVYGARNVEGCQTGERCEVISVWHVPYTFMHAYGVRSTSFREYMHCGWKLVAWRALPA
jgi:hypothetical protein